MNDAVRQLEAELAAVTAEREYQLRHAAERHAAERSAWQAERVQLLDQLVQETTGQAALSTALESARATQIALKDELAAEVLAGHAAVRRQRHDAERHSAQLAEVQDALRAATARIEELQDECTGLRHTLDELETATAGSRMTSALVVSQLKAEIETLHLTARPWEPEPEALTLPEAAPLPVPEREERDDLTPSGAAALDVLPHVDESGRRGVLTGRRRR